MRIYTEGITRITITLNKGQGDQMFNVRVWSKEEPETLTGPKRQDRNEFIIKILQASPVLVPYYLALDVLEKMSNANAVEVLYFHSDEGCVLYKDWP